MVLPSTFMSKNIKKVFRKFCFFQTYSLLLLLIFSSNQRIERFTKVNRQSWLRKPHLPIKPPVLMGGGKRLLVNWYWENKRLSDALCLTFGNFANFYRSQDEATKMLQQWMHREGYTCISGLAFCYTETVWALRFFVLFLQAMRRPPNMGQVKEPKLTLFSSKSNQVPTYTRIDTLISMKVRIDRLI